jgi:membrane protease YdiL (CAAX protease family)
VRTLGLVALVVAVLVATTVASPWVASVTGRAFSFGRVYDRVFEGLLLLGLVVTWRPLDLGTPRELGFRGSDAGRWLVRGLAAGGAGLAVGLVAGWLGGGVVPAIRFSAAKTLRKAALGFVAAIAIGAGEEVLFRGVLLRRFGRDGGRTFAVVTTAASYAAVHLLRARTEQGSATLAAGVVRTVGLFAPLAVPTAWPALAGLFALGVVLAVARLRSGTLWFPIGMHAAWVAVFRVGRLFFDVRPRPAWLVGPGWPPLVGGAAGAAALAATACLVLRATAPRS